MLEPVRVSRKSTPRPSGMSRGASARSTFESFLTAPAGETYGGLSILRALARLFDWRELSFTADGGRFIAEWRVPVSVRGPAGKAD